ncbi:serine/threonine protein kinase [bacterium]|nr:serine/threonine protein kinase [bacterium]
MQSEVLERFGNYYLLDRIGTGGMAAIYRARPATLDGNGRILVIKRVLPKMADDPSFLQMFRNEIKVCMAFNHPNIIVIHDFGELKKQTFLAMEYIDGKNLKDLIAAHSTLGRNLRIPLAAHIVEQSARGLAYAHSFGNSVTGENLHVVHRDISPHNILIGYDGRVKVIDFGIAKVDQEFTDTTKVGMIKGKARYLAPEQIRGERVDQRADIFALGNVFWELLTQRKLFCHGMDSDLPALQMIQDPNHFIEPPSTYNSEVPAELDYIVLRALTRDRDKRYQTATEMENDLRKFMSKFHPSYSTPQVESELKSIFALEIRKDREFLQELNLRAQAAIAVQPQLEDFARNTKAGNVEKKKTGIMAKLSTQVTVTPLRILVVMALYGAVGLLKMDESYGILERFRVPEHARNILEYLAKQDQARLEKQNAKRQVVPTEHHVERTIAEKPVLIAKKKTQSTRSRISR